MAKNIQKTAASPVFDEVFGWGNTGVLPYLLTKAPSPAERKRMLVEDNNALALLPYIADWRKSRIRKSLSAEIRGDKGISKPFSEHWGRTVLPFVVMPGTGAGIGAAIGAYMDSKKAPEAAAGNEDAGQSENVDSKINVKDALNNVSLKQLGAVAGGAIGLTAGIASKGIGALAALISRRRTRRKQEQYELSGASTAANWLLPGAADYNYYKNIGYLEGERDKLVAEDAGERYNDKGYAEGVTDEELQERYAARLAKIKERKEKQNA